MKPDVTINGVSMLSLGWLRETVNFPTPQSQSNTITVPGRNSPIRFTEALGRVAYQPRSFDMTFSMLGDRSDYDRLVSAVVNQFAGQLCRVTLTEDPTLYVPHGRSGDTASGPAPPDRARRSRRPFPGPGNRTGGTCPVRPCPGRSGDGRVHPSCLRTAPIPSSETAIHPCSWAARSRPR